MLELDFLTLTQFYKKSDILNALIILVNIVPLD